VIAAAAIATLDLGTGAGASLTAGSAEAAPGEIAGEAATLPSAA
jgi:hypothetical protein